MNIKRRFFADRSSANERNISILPTYNGAGPKASDVIILDSITGKPIKRKSNKIIVAGSIFTAYKHANVEPPIHLPSYNEAIGLDDSVPYQASEENRKGTFVYMFAVCTDGAGAESSQEIDVDYNNWCDPAHLVPLRYSALDITAAEKEIYFGKKTLPNYYAYYFKAFETLPVIYCQDTTGNPITSDLYNSTNKLDTEVFAEYNFKVTKEDCREFFRATTGITNAAVNSIMLLTAWYTTVNGVKVYQNIQPVTKLNIGTESLSDETKGLDVIYHLYY